MQVNVHEAKTQLSRLLELVEQGEEITIARHGKPVAQLVPTARTGFPMGVAGKDSLVPGGDAWWQPMTDEEAAEWSRGQ
jgi:prevent-host-death family protein